MKLQTPVIHFSYLIISLFFLSSCIPDKAEPETELPDAPPVPVEQVEKSNQLPVQYQKPSYMVDTGNTANLDEIVEDVAIKVGASIRSTQGPQPLWDILKRLAALKKMNVSWASDVDQSVLVDVDISSNDGFYAAIENLLRQVDYYHEMQGSTIVVKYKETRQFHIAMPFTKQLYETATGGNVLGSNDAASNIEGTIRLDSRGNEFNIWQNIQDNMDAILDTWSTISATAPVQESVPAEAGEKEGEAVAATRQVSASGNKYTIDKPVGLITVHAPRPLLDKLEIYFNSLKKELYKQVSIEAKIIEVQLNSHSSIGLNWNLLLKNLSVADAAFGVSRTRTHNTTNDTVYSDTWGRTISDNRSRTTTTNNNQTDDRTSTHDYLLDDSLTGDTGNNSFTNSITDAASNILSNVATSTANTSIGATTGIATLITETGAAGLSLVGFTFDSFLNAVKEQGQTTILSNPKLSVLNGQPALITVGRNVTYIDSIESDVDGTTGTVSYSVETERVLSGVGLALTANILDDNQIILSLVPVTSELVEPIEYREIGFGGQVGLPIINVREMSTTVKVKDGEMLVIGGLITNIEDDDGTFLPGTSNIPFFKYFFGFEEKTSRKRELIILLKSRII